MTYLLGRPRLRLKSPAVFIFFLIGSLYSVLAMAVDESVKVPLHIDGVENLDAEGLINLANRKSTLVLLDSRIVDDRGLGYIEGSISLPNTNTTCETLADTVPDKTTHVLFYCNGVKCTRSIKSIDIAKRCGYTNIYWFRGGFEEWLAKGYPYVLQ